MKVIAFHEIMPTALTVDLVGGLGNQLFKLAALIHVAKRTGRIPYVQSIQNPSPHSKVSYFDTIFRAYRGLYSTIKPTSFHQELSFAYADWRGPLRFKDNPQMNGYFQDWRYVDPDFVAKLQFPDVSSILIHGPFGGRIDQTLSCIHTLHKFYLNEKELQIKNKKDRHYI